jgi:hypothetical protein
MIHDSGLSRVVDLLNTDLTVMAIGTGAAPVRGDTQLPSEYLRKEVTESALDGNILIKELYLDESTGNTTITAWGVLGSGATESSGTGALFASTGGSITKNDTQSLTLSVEIEVVEVT